MKSANRFFTPTLKPDNRLFQNNSQVWEKTTLHVKPTNNKKELPKELSKEDVMKLNGDENLNNGQETKENTPVFHTERNKDVLIDSLKTDAPIIKTINVTVVVRKKENEEWNTTSLVKYIIQLNERIFSFVENPPLRLVHQVACLIGLIVYLGVYIVGSFFGDLYNFYLVMSFIIIGLNLINVVFTIIELRYAYTNTPLHNFLKLVVTFLKYIYWAIVIYTAMLMLFEDMITLGLLYMSSFYGTDLIYSVRLTMLFLSTIIVTMIFILEFIIRLVTCKIFCFGIKPRIKEHRYRLYKFGEECVKDESMCSICLVDFDEQDKDLIALLCLTKHIFHESCLLEWLKVQGYCPMCRSELVFSVS